MLHHAEATLNQDPTIFSELWFCIALLAGLITVSTLLSIYWLTFRRETKQFKPSPIDALTARYARGEISTADFVRRQNDLDQS
jgi:uncharacterized membrane protein